MVLIRRQSIIREFVDSEAHVEGFLLAYLGLTQDYVLLPEHESFKGYVDFYIMPGLVRRPGMVYSYIIKAKHARRDISDADITLLKRDATKQLRCYVDDERVAHTKGDTRLGLITLVFKRWELAALERLASRADCEDISEA